MLAGVGLEHADSTALFNEAFNLLDEAIDVERKRWSRIGIHAFASLFRGVSEYVRLGGILNRQQLDKLRDAAREAGVRFGSDSDIRAALANITLLL